jgi:hypothetical protein
MEQVVTPQRTKNWDGSAIAGHVYVSSGYTTVSPIYNSVTGVGDFFSPPFVANQFNLQVNFTADSTPVSDDGGIWSLWSNGLRYVSGEWLPHKIVRQGKYHYRANGKLISLGVTTELIPLFGQVGFIEKITIRNRTDSPVEVSLSPTLDPGVSGVEPLNNWGFRAPLRKVATPQPTAPNRWSNEEVNVGLYVNNGSNSIKPGETMVATVTVVMVEKDRQLPEKVNDQALIKTAVDAWEKRLATYTKNIPALTSDIAELDDYYKRSILSGLLCLWENPAYATDPFVASLGMNGGGICTYLWDTGYANNILAMMLDTKSMDIARKMVEIDLEKTNALAPGGLGVGNRYSYSTVAFTRFISAIFKFFGHNKDMFEYAKRLVMTDEAIQQPNGLIDYGVHDNMLEMWGTGWEHIVVSPNAERSWCLNELAEMGKYTGASAEERKDWQQQADKVIAAVRKELWSDEKQWFAALYPDGFKDYVYSIQVYDALWAGACTPAMEKALIAELTDAGFLGKYGITSVSKTDSLHYEVMDTDWSGGGAYVGDGPETALIMYEKGYPEIGWDILRRHFWMGQQCVYYPQETFADRPLVVIHEDVNEISGLCAANAILFGVIGFQPQYDGTLNIHPQLTAPGTINIKDFVYRGNTIDVTVSAKSLTVIKNGKTIYKGKPKLVKIL